MVAVRRSESGSTPMAKDAMDNVLLSFSALASLLPASFQALFRSTPSRDGVFWLFLSIAVAGPLGWVVFHSSGTWNTGLGAALWVTVAVTMMIYAIVAAVTRHGWRLAPLLAPYMLILGGIATVWEKTPGQPMIADSAGGAWIGVHIAMSVTTYALVTLAAVAALAAWLKERALKRKKPTTLTNLLPSVTDSEALLVNLLKVGEGVLAIGLATGLALQYRETGHVFAVTHKTLLSLTAFLVIGGLLLCHYSVGMRGRLIVRVMLLAYLLLTLGYPGVKFVTDVLIG